MQEYCFWVVTLPSLRVKSKPSKSPTEADGQLSSPTTLSVLHSVTIPTTALFKRAAYAILGLVTKGALL
jgi:hypothetical protein